MIIFKYLPVLAFLLSLFLPLGGCVKTPSIPAGGVTEFTLGTICQVNLFDQGTPELYNEIFSRFREIEETMSANMANTDVDLINQRAGIEPVAVSGDLVAILEEALYYAQISEGSFDPTVGPLVRLWNIGGGNPRLPQDDEIQKALSLADWRNLHIDRENNIVFLAKSGMSIDLGAIAKGYAADEAAGIVKRAGLPSAIIDLGGNIFAYGQKDGSKPWRIGIQNPLDARGVYIGILEVKNKSVVTSGVYERYAEIEGQRYHHILSTQTGRPVKNELLSVTVAADRSIDADALSTTLFILGYEKGMALLAARNNAEALFVFNDKSIRGTDGMQEIFTLIDETYRIVR